MAFNPLNQIKSVVGGNLVKVAGNLPSAIASRVLGGSNSSNLSNVFNGVTRGTKKNTKHFSFPIDVEAGPGVGNHGHYMMFFINEQKSAQLRFGERRKDGATSVVESKQQRQIPEYIREFRGGNYQKVKNNDSINGQVLETFGATPEQLKKIGAGQQGARGNTIGENAGKSTVFLQRAPTVRLDTAITLYMPPQVQVNYNANYQDTEIGFIAGEGATLYDAYRKGGWEGVEGAVRGGGNKTIKEAFEKFALASAEGIGIQGARATVEMIAGELVANRLELAFRGIPKRKFQYTFKMIPKSQAEAEEIRKIIFAFKANMLPEFKGGNRAGRKMKVPNTFDIQYMYHSKENDWLHKISTSVLETMNVSYGGDRYKTFHPTDDGAPPVETQLTLNFTELELITKERVFEGY